MEPLVSVIVPVYKVEKYINKCLDSILSQTYRNIEIILVDDGSPDRCPEICDEYARKDNRVKVIHKENGGVSSARNRGIEESNGEYITFVDADDWIEPDMYEKMVKNLIDSNADSVFCGFKTVFDDETCNYEVNPKQVGLVDGIQALKLAYNLDGRGYDCFMCNKIMKSTLLKEKRFKLGLTTSEDALLLAELMPDCEAVYLNNASFYNYYQRTGSASHTFGLTKQRIDNVLAWKQISFLVKRYKELNYYAKSIAFVNGNSLLSQAYIIGNNEIVAKMKKAVKRCWWAFINTEWTIKSKVKISLKYVFILCGVPKKIIKLLSK